LPHRPQVPLEPRKSPIQARSAACVEAMLEATIQVLLAVGKERLPITRVALRAGVSVGTLPEQGRTFAGCLEPSPWRSHRSRRARLQGTEGRDTPPNGALITAFLQAKTSDAKRSLALYSVSSDVDGAKIAQQMGTRFNEAIIQMLATACEPLTTDPQLVSSILQGMMVGVSRRMLESGTPEKRAEAFRRELISAASA
jgi:hypothetical protein